MIKNQKKRRRTPLLLAAPSMAARFVLICPPNVRHHAGMKPQLIVALDVPSADEILPIIRALPRDISFYKVGLELFAAEGPAVIDVLAGENKKVFLDLKLHDIPRTVAGAVTSAARHGVSLLTIHASGGKEMLRAAAEAAAGSGPKPPKLLAVTVLTSLGATDLEDTGVTGAPAEQALALARLAVSAGADGLVCSVHEVSRFREVFGPAPILVTPGVRLHPASEGGTSAFTKASADKSPGQVRPAEIPADDQKRVATPAAAVRAGSNFLVVGRPILQDPDPAAAARAILEEMSSATDHQ